MKKILIDAFKSSELEYHLAEIIAVDDKIDVNDIPDQTIMKEAAYVLGKYTGASGGFEQEDDLKGHNGDEQQSEARKQVRALKRFLAKYDESGQLREVAKKPALRPEMVLSYRGIHYHLLKPAGTRRGWIARRETDTKQVRLKCKQLSAATVVEPNSSQAHHPNQFGIVSAY